MLKSRCDYGKRNYLVKIADFINSSEFNFVIIGTAKKDVGIQEFAFLYCEEIVKN